ncbi:MAG: hypothetical protein SGBAC_002033 [Bacillariaceae sp.]
MTSTSKRLHTNIESTPSMPMTPGTLWRQTLLNKAFNHAREKSTLPSETEVLNSEHRNSFDSFVVLFSRVPMSGDIHNSSSSSRSSVKVKGGKGTEESSKGKSHSNKKSKRQSKGSIDVSLMYRQAPLQGFDFYPIRPVYYVSAAGPPQAAPALSASPLSQQPSAPKLPTTATPSTLPSKAQKPSTSPMQEPSPTISPIQEPSARPSVASMMSPSTPVPSMQVTQAPSKAQSNSICQWTVCGDIMSTRCSGVFLEPSTNVRLGGDPGGVELAVRCCSDTELPGFRKLPDDDMCPFAGTAINGQCYKEVVLDEAERLCSSIGARLCTKDEMDRRCTFGTGCDYNNLQIWTSTSGAAGYFEASDNSFKTVTLRKDDTETRVTYPCRGGITGDTSMGMLTYNEDDCTAECLFRIPWTQYRRYCSGNPDGAFSFTIPGPFAEDTELYIGNAASSWDLECAVQLSVSTSESTPFGLWGPHR